MVAKRSKVEPARLRVVRPAARRNPGRPAAADSAATEAKVLGAAQTCFALHGFEKTTNQVIADTAGISAGTIYHYFPSKPALFVAVGEHVGTTFFDRFAAAVGEGEVTFADQVRALIRLVRTLNEEDASLVAFMAVWPIEVSRHDDIGALVGGDGLTDAVDFYRQRAQDAIAAGQLRPDTDAAAVAAMITSLLFGLAMLVQAGHGADLVGPGCDALEQLVAGELFSSGRAVPLKPRRRG